MTDDEQVMREIWRDECKGWDAAAWGDDDLALSAMRLYATRVRAEERERCAKIAETTYTVDGNDSMSEVDRWVAGNGIAAAIRTGDK